MITGQAMTVAALADQLSAEDAAGPDRDLPRTAVFTDLSAPAPAREIGVATGLAGRSAAVLVGIAPGGVRPEYGELAAALTCTLTGGVPGSPAEIAVADVTAAVAAIEHTVTLCPTASATLAGLLRITAQLPVEDGLVAESLAYSVLLAGPEFAWWRASHPARPAEPDRPAVVLRREEETLHVILDRPHRRNAYNRHMRDGLAGALDLALLDDSITRVVLSGTGPSFCSGGDLDEFGTAEDVALAHLIRLNYGVAARLHRCRDRVHVRLHGACIGAGIEIPSFAAHVTARPGTFCQLPELSMGLLPGAGGTVGITRRIGRWRTAYLALTGQRIDAQTAAQWGLVDALE